MWLGKIKIKVKLKLFHVNWIKNKIGMILWSRISLLKWQMHILEHVIGKVLYWLILEL